MVLPEDGAHPGQRIELVEAPVPDEPPLPPARADEAKLSRVRGQDLPLRGVMELDYISTGAPIGKSNERKACACLSLAVDAGTGIVYAPHTSDSREAPGDSLLMESMGTTVSISSRLPALDEAREHLLAYMRG
jgi:hypothetical protein